MAASRPLFLSSISCSKLASRPSLENISSDTTLLTSAQHRWFQDERWYDLLVVLDDASSEIYYAQLVESESTVTVMQALREVIEQRGIFCALYSDRARHFFLTPRAGEEVDRGRLTQVGRALTQLGIEMIPAYSPQAR